MVDTVSLVWWLHLPCELSRVIAFPGLLGTPCCDCLWWVEEMSLVTFASLFYGSVKDVAFNKSAVRI